MPLMDLVCCDLQCCCMYLKYYLEVILTSWLFLPLSYPAVSNLLSRAILLHVAEPACLKVGTTCHILAFFTMVILCLFDCENDIKSF